MASRFRRPSPATVIAIVALVVATTGVAIGSFAPKNGKITACYSKKSGALRLVDAKKKCRKGEQRIAWNQKGRRGPRGPVGDEGFDGFDGFDGADGAEAASMLTGSFTTEVTSDVFAAPSGTSVASATESNRMTLSPAVATVARDLAVSLDPGAPVPGAAVFTFILRDDGADTDVRCSITGEARSCDSDSATAPLSAGSRLTLMHSQTGTTATDRVFRFGWRATTP
jgi:hypothetical protein